MSPSGSVSGLSVGCKGADPLSHPEIVHPGDRGRKGVSSVSHRHTHCTGSCRRGRRGIDRNGGHRHAGRDDRRPARSQHAPRQGLHPDSRSRPGRSAPAPTRRSRRSASGRRRARTSQAPPQTSIRSRELPDGSRPHPGRGHVLDGRLLLARGQGSSCYAMFEPTATVAPARSASAGATPASAPRPPSASSSSSAASAQPSSPATTAVHDGARVSQSRVELPSYSTNGRAHAPARSCVRAEGSARSRPTSTSGQAGRLRSRRARPPAAARHPHQAENPVRFRSGRAAQRGPTPTQALSPDPPGSAIVTTLGHR